MGSSPGSQADRQSVSTDRITSRATAAEVKRAWAPRLAAAAALKCAAPGSYICARSGRHATLTEQPRLIDPFARAITYLRVSVTDRCDFRCVYCMSEHMEFLPKAELLTLEELDRLCSAFVGLGVEKLRITGGEPLVRKGIMTFFRAMSRHLATGALQGADADHQRQPAPPLRGRARRLRRPPGQRLARHARRGEVRPHHPLGPPRPGDGRHRRRRRGRAPGQDQHRGAQGRQRGRAPRPRRLVRRARLRPHLHRGHADGRSRQRGPARPVLVAQGPAPRARDPLDARPTPPSAPAARPATPASPRPAAGSASSPRSPTISARAATGCGSPAPASSSCASARRTTPTCARALRANPDDDAPLRRGDRRRHRPQAQGPRLRLFAPDRRTARSRGT